MTFRHHRTQNTPSVKSFSDFQSAQKKWRNFYRWEAIRAKKESKLPASLRLIGEWVDFYLKRHSRKPAKVDVSGIQKMQRRLALISH